MSIPNCTAHIWPLGYASGQPVKMVLNGAATDAEVHAMVARHHGATARCYWIYRPRSEDLAPVTEEYARYMTRGDNT